MLWLCKGDPLVNVLRNTFRAQPIRIPEARVTPLIVFALAAGRFQFIGPLADLVSTRTSARLGELKPEPSPMANLKENKSGNVNLDLGLKILDGFLRGFNISGCLPAVSAQFAKAADVSFEFQDVERRAVPLSAIGKALKSRSFEVEHGLIAEAVSKAVRPEFFIVDSTISSRDFSIAASTKTSADFKIKLAKIQEAVDASAKVKVQSKSKRELTFIGPRPLPFAFTCCRVSFDQSGGNIRLAPYVGRAAYARPDQQGEQALRHAVPTPQAGMLEWEP